MSARAELRARRVVAAMQRELWRQVQDGTLISAGQVMGDGHMVVEGSIDMARLAYVTELVLLQEFYPALGAAS